MHNHVRCGDIVVDAALISRSLDTDEFEGQWVVLSLENDVRSVLLDLMRPEARDAALIGHLERLERVTDHLYEVSVALGSPKPRQLRRRLGALQRGRRGGRRGNFVRYAPGEQQQQNLSHEELHVATSKVHPKQLRRVPSPLFP